MPSILRTLTVAAGGLLLAACGSGQQSAAGPGGQAGAAMVGVVVAQPQTVPFVTELPGRTTPYLVAEVRPQVTGILSRRSFVEGTEVKAGAPLYQIEPATYQAALESAQANLERAAANRELAGVKARRYAELVTIEAVSKQANDEAQAAFKQAAAEVAASRAALQKAEIDLTFTRVTAPIAGRIGRSAVTAGALVTANQAAALATIQQLDPIYVDLTQSSTEILGLKRDLEAGRLQRARDATLPVALVLEDGTEYAHPGKLAVSEVSVDPGTGSVTLRAVFPNPKGDLLPGMYVRARLAQGSRQSAFVVPHAALSRDPRGNPLVMVINAEGKAEMRPVEAPQSLANAWVITRGLAAGDRVIVDGLQKIRPGMPVQPQTTGAPAGSAPGAVGAAGPAPATPPNAGNSATKGPDPAPVPPAGGDRPGTKSGGDSPAPSQRGSPGANAAAAGK